MGFLDRLFFRKKTETTVTRSESGESYEDFMLTGGWQKNDYQLNSGWRLLAVYRCISLISETIAMLPFNLMRKDGESLIVSKDHRNSTIFRTDPNGMQTWFDFMMHLVSQTLTHGNGYALIVRDSYLRIKEIISLSNDECMPYYEVNGIDRKLYYYIHGKAYKKEDVIHIRCLGSDGIIGKSPIEIARDAISGGLSQQAYNKAIYDNGLNTQGVLSTPALLSDAAIGRLKTQFDKLKGAKNSGGTLVLEEGLAYAKTSMSPSDAQFLESRRFTLDEIGRLYGVPAHKIGNLDRSTNNNIEHQDLEFFKSCISAWEERIEQEFAKKCLFGEDRLNHSFLFDNTKLLRADLKARAEYTTSLFNKGAITPNQIRVMEGLNPMDVEAMNKTYLQLNMSDIDKLEENGKQNIKNTEPAVQAKEL